MKKRELASTCMVRDPDWVDVSYPSATATVQDRQASQERDYHRAVNKGFRPIHPSDVRAPE